MQPPQHLLLIQLQALHAQLQLAPVFALFLFQQVAPQRQHKDGEKDEEQYHG